MSRPGNLNEAVSYDPLPNPQDHTQDMPYDPPAPSTPLHQDQGLASPHLDTFDFDPNAVLPRPQFMGQDGMRDSFASYGSRPQSEGGSLYALNAESLSARESPRPGSFATRYRDDPSSPSGDVEEEPGVPMSNVSGNRYLKEKQAVYAAPGVKSRRNIIILSVIGGLILLIVAVVVPIYFAVIKPHSHKNESASGSTGSSSGSPSSTGAPTPPKAAIVTGGDGSTITLDDGSTMIYSNKFGGSWYHDPSDPFNNAAQAQSWSPALNQTFHWGTDRIRGVNLGGWLTTEPFISPALYQKYPGTVDEWELSAAMAADTAGGGLGQLEDHYKTFITEADFAQIAGAGLNFVRIPIPFWAIETWSGEPFLAKTAWTYFLKAIGWARKYGIRINLDLHALPGSQNGWNHSGRLGTISFLNGTMGLANAQRSLDYIRIIAEFISQPQYKDVVVMFGITNEPQVPFIGQENLQRYYLQAYNVVRNAGGVGAGNGPLISYHDGFAGLNNWAGFLPGADRIGLDYHPYLCFATQTSDPISANVNKPCTAWGGAMNDSMTAFGFTAAGEFSNAINDCGTFVNGVGQGTRYEGTYATGGPWPKIGSCDSWINWQSWDATMKNNIQSFALSSMDALQHWFFWTWKIGNSTTSGTVESPAWSYQLGLQNGWMPTDPRSANGVCGNTDPWSGKLPASATGGSGAGNIPASATSSIGWPPTAISNAADPTLLPQYTQTGPIPTLPVPTFSASGSASIDAGNGWANPSDTVGVAVPIASCSYLSPWVESAVAAPPACPTGAAARAVPRSQVTPAPRQ